MNKRQTRTTTEEKTKLAPLFKVLLHNDEVTSMYEVIETLQRVFAFTISKAIRVMMEAHTNGIALCIVEAQEDAEFHAFMLQVHSLMSSIEPEE